jgi:hypothetical protein
MTKAMLRMASGTLPILGWKDGTGRQQAVQQQSWHESTSLAPAGARPGRAPMTSDDFTVALAADSACAASVLTRYLPPNRGPELKAYMWQGHRRCWSRLLSAATMTARDRYNSTCDAAMRKERSQVIPHSRSARTRAITAATRPRTPRKRERSRRSWPDWRRSHPFLAAGLKTERSPYLVHIAAH